MTKITKAQIAERTSFEDIYAEISKLKIKEAELDVVLNRANNESSGLRSEIHRWNDIAALKRRALVNQQQH